MEQIFTILFDKDEVTWQAMLYELVRTEQMDPWDIDIALLSQRFFEMLRTMRALDLRISGKVLLAAAILLKLKSHALLEKDLAALDRLIWEPEEELLLDEEVQQLSKEEIGKLIPRTPQMRKRKVSIYDLVQALQLALEVKRRRVLREIPPMPLEIPEHKIDVGALITSLYSKIVAFFAANKAKLTFSMLTPSNSRHDKVYTLIPLLHLSNQRKVDLYQYKPFDEIEISLLENWTSEEATETNVGGEMQERIN